MQTLFVSRPRSGLATEICFGRFHLLSREVEAQRLALLRERGRASGRWGGGAFGQRPEIAIFSDGYGSKLKPPGDRKFWPMMSMFPLTGVPFGVPIFDPQPDRVPRLPSLIELKVGRLWGATALHKSDFLLLGGTHTHTCSQQFVKEMVGAFSIIKKTYKPHLFRSSTGFPKGQTELKGNSHG